jgi:hypothetical protein
MKIQCPNCNALTTIHPKRFPELSELECSVCGEVTILKNGLNRIVKIEFVLTDPGIIPEKNNPEKTVETFHQNEFRQPSCSSPQQKELYEEQHEDVQQE